MNQKIMSMESTLKTYKNSTNKLVNITYISELEQLNINNLDNNICTITIKNDLSKTDKIKLLGLLCKNLSIEIEHLNINNNMFLSCFSKEYYSALILGDREITITSQDFNFLLVLHDEVLKLLKNNFNNEIKEIAQRI